MIVPTLEKSFVTSPRAAAGKYSSKASPVKPWPVRQMGLGIARAQLTGGPRRARSLANGMPAARLIAVNDRLIGEIFPSSRVTEAGGTAIISRLACDTACVRFDSVATR